MTLEELKARAYDLIVLREQATAELMRINEQIGQILIAKSDGGVVLKENKKS